ncbi:lipopolysaccharide assembly LapA domain-containing protein [Listeria sp. PSOL-1]|uniref:LapA family protein n=1 Tax=Listeria sp. PSOL-1 TaxID=1844999 RepID=UPI0013CF448F|nr:LapA family protein [Listeria sp. PSOL-1]
MKKTSSEQKPKVPIKMIISAVLVVLIVIFAAINSSMVTVNFLFAKVSSPLVLIILGSTLIGALIMFGFSYFNRRK